MALFDLIHVANITLTGIKLGGCVVNLPMVPLLYLLGRLCNFFVSNNIARV